MYTTSEIASLGIRRGFLLFDHISEITCRDDYLVVKTPTNKKYISANFVLFRNPPNAESINTWPEIFESEFKHDNYVSHIKLEWDRSFRNNSVFNLFINKGFELEEYETLVLNRAKKPRSYNNQIQVKEINYAEDWAQIIKDQMYFRYPSLTVEYYKDFSEKLMSAYQTLLQKGLCKWFGAYYENTLIGSLGLLWSNEIVDLQRVVVGENYRNKGVCSTLIHWVTDWILKNMSTQRIVICSEKDSIASQIYKNCGYEFHEELLALRKYPRF